MVEDAVRPRYRLSLGAHTFLVLREVGRPPVRIHLDAGTGLPGKVTLTEEHPPRWRTRYGPRAGV